MYVSKPSEIETLLEESNIVTIVHKTGFEWQEVKLIPSVQFSAKTSFTSEGHIYDYEFKSKVVNPPDHDFYIVKLLFADGSTQLIGSIDFPVYVTYNSTYSDHEEILASFTYKSDLKHTLNEG